MLLSPMMKKSSFLLQDFQKKIITLFLNDYFRNYLQKGSGSYLSLFNYDQINFYWCNDMVFENEGGINGAWTPLYKDSLFLQPDFFNEKFRKSLQTNQFFKEYQLSFDMTFQQLNKICNQEKIKTNDKYMLFFSNFKSYLLTKQLYQKQTVNATPFVSKCFIKDLDKYMFVYSLFAGENNYRIITIMHELYHKYQFEFSFISKILYICNLFISRLFTYQQQCNMQWTIQGDVRKHVDNYSTQKIVHFFYQLINSLHNFYDVINGKSNFNEKQKENILKQYKNNFQLYQFKLLFSVYKQYDILQNDFVQQIQQFIKG